MCSLGRGLRSLALLALAACVSHSSGERVHAQGGTTGAGTQTPASAASALPTAAQPTAAIDVAAAPAPLPIAGLDAVRARVLAADTDGALMLIAGLRPDDLARPEIAYLRARLFERNGKLTDALAALPALLTSLPPAVANDATTRRAQWLARTNKCKEARPLLATLLAKASDSELVLAAAQCALSDADAPAALALLRSLKGNAEKSFQARLLLARALARTGDRAGAARTLHELYVDKPERSRNGEIESELTGLREKLVLDDEERLTRAEKLLAALQPDAAIAELERMHAPKAKLLRARVLHLRGMALFKMRSRYAEAAKVLSEAVVAGDVAAKLLAKASGKSLAAWSASGAPHDTRAEDSFHAAQALARADRDADAVRSYRAFAKRFPDHKLTMDALHDAAWLELRHDLPDGEAHMRAFLAEAEKKGERDAAQSGLWELAFFLFGKDRYAQAVPLFEKYAQSSEASMVKARGLYWAARAALLTKQNTLAITHFREALAVEPLHWYALLSRQRLAQLGESVPDPFAAKAASSEAAAPAQAAAAMPFAMPALAVPVEVNLYAQLGLVDDAVKAMRAHEPEWQRTLPADTGLIAICAAYQRMAEYARPYRLAEGAHAGAIQNLPVGLERAYWDMLFPRPYASDVAAATQKENLPDDFVYSIMRKESAFDPSVVSYADAIGLMQLIEPTARAIAGQIGITPFKRTLLYQPAINIQLGAHYLANLIARYGGQVVPAIAAYNAGEHRIGPWLARAQKRSADKRIELDRWVEDIPIDQTRNYVRRVVANWARYRYLAQPDKPWPLELPELLTN